MLDSIKDHTNGKSFGLFDTVFHEVGDAIAILAMDRQKKFPVIIDANKQFEIETDYAGKDLNGRNLLSIVRFDSKFIDTFPENLRKNSDKNNPVTIPGELLSRDGSSRPVRCTIRPFSCNSSKGNLVCVLRADDQKLYDRPDILTSRFLSCLSHDLRTPLNGIVGFSQIMMSEMLGPLGTGQYLDYARDIYGASQDLIRLVDGFLDISRTIQGENFPLEESRIPVFDIVSKAIEEANIKYSHADVSFRNDVVPDLPDISGDHDRLLTALTIIFANAASRTPGHDSIDISARLKNDGKIEILCRDRGTPFSRNQLDGTFRLFHVEGDVYTSGFQASGITLPLAKIIVDRHQGSIGVTNHAATGVVWMVCLPVSKALKD